ncbi:uncharacterized protein LOC141600573 [Silene latifolia]|uniref:uncharacterized protein LOC141600573 n=1 Tax=Silene latifolia TaxID=37657 RepID=UPI003D76E3D3
MPESSDTPDQYSTFDDPLFPTQNDQPNLKLTDVLLDGTNFLQWQRDVVQALLSKNKSGFITGECSMPDKTDKTYNQWIRCDLSVLRWILHSISQPRRDNLQYAASAKNLCKMKNLWESIDQMDHVPVCVCGAMFACTCQLLKKILHKETHSKLIQLLMGLNSSYEQVQTTVLSMDPLPSINRTLDLLQKIEKHKVLNDSANEIFVETASYASKKRFNNSSFQGQASKKSKDSDACVDGHISERCYKYKAYMAKKGKANVADSVQTVNNVISANHVQDEEYVDISPLDTMVPYNQHVHYSGMVFGPVSFNVHNSTNMLNDTSWIVDTGTSEHIICHEQLLYNIKILYKPIYVALPDGTLKKVQKTGNTYFTHNIILKNAIHSRF